MKPSLFLYLLVVMSGCATQNIKYDRNKILKKYSADYQIFVDAKKMNLEKNYLDKDNIENVRINKKAKELKITQIKRTKFVEINNLNLDRILVEGRGLNKKKIGLIIIDGIPIVDSLIMQTKIDLNAIKSVDIVRRRNR